jgi:hypothetical protein
MKLFYKIFLISIIAISGFVIVSCNRETKTDKEQKKNNYNLKDTMSINQENAMIKEFHTFIDSLDSTNDASVLLATEKFKSVFAGQSQGICDSALVIFLNLTDTLVVSLNEKLENDTTDYQAFINGEICSTEVIQFLKSLSENGFSLKSSDGMVYIDLNYDYIIRNFSSYVSGPMNAYLTEIQMENKV